MSKSRLPLRAERYASLTWVVELVRFDGVRKPWGHYDSAHAAMVEAARLKKVGCPAEVRDTCPAPRWRRSA